MAKKTNRRLRQLANQAQAERVPRFIPGEEEGPILSRLGFILASVLVFVIVVAGAVVFGGRQIERSLEIRAVQVLRSNGFTSVQVDADGRQLHATGTVVDEADEETVRDILLAGVGGATKVRVDLAVATTELTPVTVPADPLQITWDGGEVTVVGTVSTEEVRDFILSRLDVGFGDAIDATGLEVVDDVADEGGWLAATLESVLIVAREVDEGSVVVNSEADVVTVSAVMPDRQTRAEARRAVEDLLDPGPLDFVSALTLEAAPPPPPPVEVVELQENLDDLIAGKIVEFELDSAELTAEGRALLDEVLEALRQFPNVAVEIAGHTDAQGTEEYNLDLSRRRAEAVLAYLVANGEDPGRFEVIGYGEAQPVADNATEEGRARNRRIEFIALED